MNLNEAQQEAVNHTDGPAMVLAGPGSGKTAVVTGRTLRLITECNISPGNILVITFTKAAAKEMKDRFERLGGEKVKARGEVNFGTFHAVFFKILKYAYGFSGDSILRDADANRFLLHLIDERGLEAADVGELISDIKSEIGRVKSNGIKLTDYRASSCPAEDFAYIFNKYTRELERRRLVDFDDMMIMTRELLVHRPDILELWQDKFKYIMVDEFQDINPLQYEIVKMLAGPRANLFIVGDDDQSIYAFRGSDPGIMLGFKNDYPKAKEILLNYNYRSKKNIVETAGRLIRNNKNRFSKEILTIREEGEPVEVMDFENAKEECSFIVQKIREYHEKGINYSQMASIHRTNSGAEGIVRALSEANIPFTVKEGIPCIFDHFIARDVLDYIRLALGERKRETILHIINRPNRFFSRDMLLADPFSFETLKGMLGQKKWACEALDRLEYDLSYIKRGTPFSAVSYIRKGIRYEEFLQEYAEKKGIDVKGLFSVLEEISEDAREFTRFDDWFDHIAKIRTEIYRQREMDGNSRRDAVSVVTMHGSKGLEWDVVFVPQMVDGVSPYKKAVTADEIEQERRMFYVAVTRAKMKLFVSTVKIRSGMPTTPSVFVEEIRKT